MPSFAWSRAMTANQLDDRPLANWKYRRLPFNAMVQVLQRGTTTGVRQTISTGAQEIEQKSPVQGGGTAGVTPSPLNTTITEFVGMAGDEIVISNDEVAGGTPTVDGKIIVNPL